jgi:hypothetical protein
MESYIDFIKKYNNEKSISSATDSEFGNFLKGGANNIKGGFPSVYMIDSDPESDSLREYNSNVDISNILNKKKVNPFLNVSQDNSNGGFLNLFHSDTKKEISNQLNSVSNKSDTVVQTAGNKTETTINLPDELEFISTTKDQVGGGDNLTESSINLPDQLEIISITKEQVGGDDNLTESSIDLPYELEIVSITKEQVGGNLDNLFIKNVTKDNNLNTTSLDLPNDFEVVSIDQAGGYDNLTESSIDLPNELEIISITNDQIGGYDNIFLKNVSKKNDKNTTSIDLPNELEIMSGGDNEFSETTIDLPDILDIVSITNEQLGGDNSIHNVFLKNMLPQKKHNLDTSIDLPDNFEIMSINTKDCDEHIDTDNTTMDLPSDLEIISIN